MAFSLSGSNSHAGRYLIKPEDIEKMINKEDSDDDTTAKTELSAEEIAVLQKMLTETQDILESDDFRRVLDSSIEIGFSLVMDTMLSCFVTDLNGLNGDNGFSNPNSVQKPLAKLLPSIKQVFDSRQKNDEQLNLVRHLLCLDILNCFAANIYEAFCEPAK